MYTLLKKIAFKIDNSQYSIFSNLGDLSFYTLEELKSLALDFNTTSMHLDNEILTFWTNKNTKYEILYTLSGSFIKIKSETWFDPYSYFKK